MQILGLQLDPPFIRIAQIQRKSSGVKILHWATETTDALEHVKRLYIRAFKGKTVTGLPLSSLFIRSLEIPLTSSKHLSEVISFQSEATSHFNPTETLSVPTFTKKGKNKVDTLLFTSSRILLRSHLQNWRTWDVDPDLVSAVPLALIQYTRWKYPALTSAFLIDLGSSEWSCIWMENGQLQKSHFIGGGTEALLSAFGEDRKRVLLPKEISIFAKQYDLLQIKSHVTPLLSARLEDMRHELAKIFCSFHKLAGTKPILFTGQVNAFTHLREFLLAEIQEWCSEEIASDVEEGKHAVALGLAFEELTQPLQFRREEFFPPKKWKKAGIYAMALSGISLLLGSATFILGSYLIQSQKEKMIQTLAAYLKQEDQTLQQSLFSKGGNEEEILSRWNRAIASYKKEYPFILRAPKVSELLEWLTPFLNQENNPISLVSMRYKLLQFPTLDNPAEPYQAKLEIELHIPNPTSARKLHEALLQDKKWIYLDHAVEWDALNNDIYRSSFYLKNKDGFYVP